MDLELVEAQRKLQEDFMHQDLQLLFGNCDKELAHNQFPFSNDEISRAERRHFEQVMHEKMKEYHAKIQFPYRAKVELRNSLRRPIPGLIFLLPRLCFIWLDCFIWLRVRKIGFTDRA